MILKKIRTNISWQDRVDKCISLIAENGTSVNFLILLGALAFVIIAIDLDTELSVQKDEINQVVGVLNESISTIQLDAADQVVLDPPEIGTLPVVSAGGFKSDFVSFPSDRSPPSL